MNQTIKIPLSIKVIAVCLLVSLGNALILAHHSGQELEDAILDQVESRVFVFLQGIVGEIRHLPDPLAAVPLQQVLKAQHQQGQQKSLGFAILKLYLYDQEGRIVAYTGGEEETVKDMSGHYGDVVRHGQTFWLEEVEFSLVRDKQVAVMDAIIPVQLESGIVGGLEAEINMQETMAIIKERDNHYKQAITWMIVVHAVLLSVMVSWLIHRLLVRHIHHYDNVTQAIGEGKLTSRVVNVLPGDELGRLGGSINRMAENIERLVQEQENAYLQSLRSLTQALEAKDAYTAGHSSRVSKFSLQLGQYLGLDDTQLELLRKGALMHDLGKIGIRDHILNKPEPLTAEEFAEMQSHPAQTAAIMRPLKRFKEFVEIAAWHHERWDGQGYPDGLRGEAIPLLARIVSIADTWDAMTGNRIYRQGMPPEKALAILEAEQNSGQWDPGLLARFMQMMRENIAYNTEKTGTVADVSRL